MKRFRSDDELLADILSIIRRTKKSNWDLKGWSSPKEPAVREALKCLGFDLNSEHIAAGRKGSFVGTEARIDDLARQLETLGPAYFDHEADNFCRSGRVFALAEIRSWLYYVEELESIDLHHVVYATFLCQLASHHRDETSMRRLAKLVAKAQRHHQPE